MVLLPKLGRVFKRIGLLEMIWELCVSIIKNCLQASITLNDYLLGFIQGKGVGTSIWK